jgi:hypothetical protein
MGAINLPAVSKRLAQDGRVRGIWRLVFVVPPKEGWLIAHFHLRSPQLSEMMLSLRGNSIVEGDVLVLCILSMPLPMKVIVSHDQNQVQHPSPSKENTS